MTAYLVIFLAGFAGSFHCLGMCGGFACGLGSDPRGRAATLRRHLLYNLGRLASYLFLGALAGAAGRLALLTSSSPLEPSLLLGQRLLTFGAGLLMVVMALQLFGLLQRRHGPALVAAGPAPDSGFGGGALVVSLRSLLSAPGAAAPLAFGVVNGFLPCPLVYAFVAQAASTAEPLPAVLTMTAFGLGTFPAMLFMGGLGRLMGPAWRRSGLRLLGVRLAGAFILLLGLVTIARGIPALAESSLLHGFLEICRP